MAENNTKKILFNKSTLISLKAELLRKKEEVNEKKCLPQHKVENFKPPKPRTIETLEKPSFREKLIAIDTEELEACRKVKLALEKKAELYEHLSDCAGTSQLGGHFLVDFNTKKQQEPVPLREPTPQHDHQTEDSSLIEDDDSDWTEFKDCLGRTRRCLKTDLEEFRQKDHRLSQVVHRETSEGNEEQQVVAPEPARDKPYLVQKTADYLQTLRERWERQEEALLNKEHDVHYQDVLFDEARQHGVSYFSFSTDEAERKKQMEELTSLRAETERAQAAAAERRRRRDELVAARLASAKARRRLRAGLPAEDPEEDREKFTKCLLEFLTKQKDEADAEAKEKERKAKEEQEKERQKLRDAYVRDWDVGKDGVEKKGFRTMTQEEYVEQQRGKRINEFAPPKESSSRHASSYFDDEGRRTEPEFSKPKTWQDVRPDVAPPPPTIGDLSDLNETGLYFTTKKDDRKLKYKNFVKEQEPVAIVDELSEDEHTNQTRKPEKRRNSQERHTEIAPPPTYEYYGPTPKQVRSKKPFYSDPLEAYAQGSKALESTCTDKKIAQDYDFTLVD